MTPTQDMTPYFACELLSAEPLRDAENGQPGVGITVTDGDACISLCLSLNDAAMLLRQVRVALTEFAKGQEYPDG